MGQRADRHGARGRPRRLKSSCDHVAHSWAAVHRHCFAPGALAMHLPDLAWCGVSRQSSWTQVVAEQTPCPTEVLQRAYEPPYGDELPYQIQHTNWAQQPDGLRCILVDMIIRCPPLCFPIAADRQTLGCDREPIDVCIKQTR